MRAKSGTGSSINWYSIDAVVKDLLGEVWLLGRRLWAGADVKHVHGLLPNKFDLLNERVVGVRCEHIRVQDVQEVSRVYHCAAWEYIQHVVPVMSRMRPETESKWVFARVTLPAAVEANLWSRNNETHFGTTLGLS